MISKKQQKKQVKQECRFIARNAGLLFSRILLLCCLFLLFFSLHPTSVYLFAAFAFFPWILSGLLSGKKKYAGSPILFSCAQKYLYTYPHFIAEKYTSPIIMAAMIFWQMTLLGQPVKYAILRNAPALCLLIYLISRILFTILVKKRIRRYYEDLEILNIQSIQSSMR